MADAALAIGPGLSLPLDAVTETFAILAKRGSGKTYTAKVLVEELLDAGQPVCVIDPVGVWWGLRSSADGKHDGQPVVIFGGDHADVPLEQTAGQLLADLIVDQDLAAVLDLSSLSKRASRRFMTDFLERLYQRNRDPLHLVVDEADAFAPQRAAAEGARLLGAMEDVVRRGRARGIGVTLISQRPAVLNKDVLTQAEVLVAMRITAPRDNAAIDEWIKQHDVEDQAGDVKASLPSLPTGTAWVWSPSWLGVLQKVAVRRARTFDSSATPKAGQRRPTPRRMAKVDLTQLGEQIEATVERAKADNPRELRRRIAQLEHELAVERAKPEPEPVKVRVEVPVLAPEIVDQIEAALSPAAALLEEVQETLAKHRVWAEQQLQHRLPVEAKQGSPSRGRSSAASQGEWPGERLTPGTSGPEKRSPARQQEMRSDGAGDRPQLKAGARRILVTLARHHPMRVTRAQLGTLAGFKITGGTFQTYWSTLKRHGLVDEADDIGITQAGFDYLGEIPPAPMTTEEVLGRWRSVLKAGARQMLDVLVDIYPAGIGRDELADRVEMTASGGTFQTYLSTLRRNGLVDVAGEIRASDSLFLGGRP